MASTSAFSSLFSERPKIDLSNYFTGAVDDNLRSHLVKVYSSLTFTLFCCALGAVADIYYNVGGILTTLLTFGSMMYLASDPDKFNYGKRLAILSAFGFFQGCSLGDLIAYAAYVDPRIISTAFLATATVFACFTASALLARRQSYLALGGLLSSGVSWLLLIGLLNMFFRSKLAFSAVLYLGLLIFCGYVLYDTQVIIEKFHRGDRDFVWHSVELFVDFVAIFVRLVIILTENSQEKKKNRR